MNRFGPRIWGPYQRSRPDTTILEEVDDQSQQSKLEWGKLSEIEEKTGSNQSQS